MLDGQAPRSRAWLGWTVSGLIGAGLMSFWSTVTHSEMDLSSISEGTLVSVAAADEPVSAPARLVDPAPVPSDEPPLIEPSPDVTANNAAVRSVIEKQLPSATAEEREIWYNQLKNLPPGAVEDILRFRQEIRRPNSPLWNPLPGEKQLKPPSTLQSLPNGVVPARIADSQPTDPSTLETLRRMREVILQNLMHAHTSGYCRLVPLTSPVRDMTATDDFHVALRWDGVTLELTGHHFERTYRPLDLATSGRGWMEISTPGGSAYTQSAHLILGSDGKLGVSAGGEFLPLVPEIQIPNEMVRVEINPAGTVLAWTAEEEEPMEIASLVLAAPRDAESMVYGPHGWLMPRNPEEPIERARPTELRGAVELHVGMLKRSNVDVAAERARLAEIEALLQQLTPPPVYHPESLSDLNELPTY